MKVIIAGSRTITDRKLVEEAIEASCFSITEVVCGMARGVDTVGFNWAKDNNIPVKEFPADWEKYGRAAGPIRNKQMAEYADALIAVMAPNSKGTQNMVETARNLWVDGGAAGRPMGNNYLYFRSRREVKV